MSQPFSAASCMPRGASCPPHKECQLAIAQCCARNEEARCRPNFADDVSQLENAAEVVPNHLLFFIVLVCLRPSHRAEKVRRWCRIQQSYPAMQCPLAGMLGSWCSDRRHELLTVQHREVSASSSPYRWEPAETNGTELSRPAIPAPATIEIQLAHWLARRACLQALIPPASPARSRNSSGRA